VILRHLQRVTPHARGVANRFEALKSNLHLEDPHVTAAKASQYWIHTPAWCMVVFVDQLGSRRPSTVIRYPARGARSVDVAGADLGSQEQRRGRSAGGERPGRAQGTSEGNLAPASEVHEENLAARRALTAENVGHRWDGG